MARLVRNTDGIHPSTWGTEAGKLLIKLRAIDQGKYDEKVMKK